MTPTACIDSAREHGREDAQMTLPLKTPTTFSSVYSLAGYVRNARISVRKEYNAYVEGYSDYAF